MKRIKHVLIVAVALILTCAISVAATYAYLYDKSDTAINTISAGKVKVSLSEARVNEDGQLLDVDGNVWTAESGKDKAPRVLNNHYKLLPNRTYTKDPTIYVEEGSEPCLLLLVVYIPKELQDVIYYNGGEDDILTQARNNGWWGQRFDEDYSDNPDEYDVFVYAAGDQIARPGDVIPVFDHILVKKDATYEQLQKVDLSEMRITAYGVQSEFLADDLSPNEIWELVQEAFDPFGTNP